MLNNKHTKYIKDPQASNSVFDDVIYSGKENPLTDELNRQLWHTSYGRTSVFALEQVLERTLMAFGFGLGLSAYHYLDEEIRKTSLYESGSFYVMVFFFVATVTILIVQASTTPYVNRKMGGDYHQLYDNQERMMAIQKRQLQQTEKHLNNSIILANAVHAQTQAIAATTT